MQFIAILVAVLGGAANPLQAAANSQLNKRLGQPIWATLIVYASGLAGMLLVLLFVRPALPGASRAAGVPWWAWVGGMISLGSTLAGVTMTQKLGSGLFTAASLTTAVLLSVTLDNFGLMGLKQHPASIARLVGCALLIAGVWLVARF